MSDASPPAVPEPEPPPASPSAPVPAPAPAPAGPLGLRASDAERDRYVDVLREAYAEGRLAHDEYEERMSAAYAARTYAELLPLVQDLPVPPGTLPVPAGAAAFPPVPAHAVPPRPSVAGGVVPGGAWGIEVAPAGTPAADQPVVAVFSGTERRGRWLVPPRLTTAAVFGGVELDLSDAVLAAPEVELNVVAVFGGVEITVPHGVEVRLEGVAVFGGRAGPKDSVVPPPGAPVVRVSGFALFGGVDVKRPKVRPAPPTLPPGSAPPGLPAS